MVTLSRWLHRLFKWLWRVVSHWLWPLAIRHRWRCSWANRPVRGFRIHSKPAWVRREIIRLKALMPEAGSRSLAHHFNRDLALRRHMTVGKTYVAYTIKKQHYAILEARRKLKHRIPRPLPRNLIWGLDLMVKTDTQGRQHLVLAILDHASRACLRLQRLPDKSALTLLRHVIETCRRYHALRLLGIRPQRTDLGCPWQNGRVERFIGTVKAMLSEGTVGNADRLDYALRQVRMSYNHFRPHDHLQGRTPAEVWAGIDVFAPTLPRIARWAQRGSLSVGPSG